MNIKIFPNEAIAKARKKPYMVSEMLLWLHVMHSPTEALIRKESAFKKARTLDIVF